MTMSNRTEHDNGPAELSKYMLPNQLAWTIFELAYRAKGALELLRIHESEDRRIDQSDELTGIGYPLQGLARDIEAAAIVVSNGERGAA